MPGEQRAQRALGVSLAVLGLLGWLGTAETAHADILEHGFVDPCSVATHLESDITCEFCKTPHAAPDACKQTFTPRGYLKKCRTHGDHQGWGEVWCSPKPPAVAPPYDWKQHVPKLKTLALVAGLVGMLLLSRRYWSNDRPAT